MRAIHGTNCGRCGDERHEEAWSIEQISWEELKEDYSEPTVADGEVFFVLLLVWK